MSIGICRNTFAAFEHIDNIAMGYQLTLDVFHYTSVFLIRMPMSSTTRAFIIARNIDYVMSESLSMSHHLISVI